MELTQEQLTTIINEAITKNNTIIKEQLDARIKAIISETLKEIGKDFITKEQLNELKTSISQDIAKANEAITKVASETETKIKELRTTPAAVKSWWNRDLI